MPYPEICPECGGAFRNTGTHYTARRNEVGRHVLLELGCQNTQRRYWWDFTSGTAAEDSTTPGRRAATLNHEQSNGHAAVATLESVIAVATTTAPPVPTSIVTEPVLDEEPVPVTSELDSAPPLGEAESESMLPARVPEGEAAAAPQSLKEAFVRQLQLDRLTLRQMRTWLMADDARRAMEVAAGATEATYERLALILFGTDLQQLLGKQPAPTPPPGMTAEERLELQREKARIRARLRRAAAKARSQQS